jgi:hypothetical protein
MVHVFRRSNFAGGRCKIFPVKGMELEPERVYLGAVNQTHDVRLQKTAS